MRSPRLERYNGNSTVEIVGEAAPGVSTGTAMDEMEKLVSQLPTGFGLEWTAMSTRNACPVPRHRRCMPSRCWWYSLCSGRPV
ncbi:Acriflavine resistance protein B [Serratia fonticola]|uniref:Acriflavine resistance protein B n=1 Tax=Serratia fonticola TaxID=47917 RepID=A0A4U9UHB6_SERFO|nr:Acriflavine resistance protein B [Serratia fonticola]